jgi:hypothetical protein
MLLVEALSLRSYLAENPEVLIHATDDRRPLTLRWSTALPPQAVIVMMVGNSLDYDEIATQMGKAPPSANRQLAFMVSPSSAMDRGRPGCRR